MIHIGKKVYDPLTNTYSTGHWVKDSYGNWYPIWNGTKDTHLICEDYKSLDGDCVSRQVVKEQMIKYGFRAPDMTVTEFVEDLPPITPQQKSGHWIIIDDCELFMAKCSECGEIVDSRMMHKYPYCHCGAKMVKPQERSE